MTHHKTHLALLGALSLLLAAPITLAAPQVDQNLGTWSDNLTNNVGLATNLPESFGTIYKPITRLVTLSDTAQLACRQSPCAADEAPGKYGQIATTPIAPVSFSAWGWAYLKVSTSQRPDLMAPSPADVEVRFLGNDGTTRGPFQLVAPDDSRWSARVDLSTVPASVTSGRLLVHLREKVTVVGVRDDAANRPVGDPADLRIAPTFEGAKVTWSSRAVVNVATSAPATTCANASFNVRVRVAVSLVNAQDLIVWVPLSTPAADAFGRTYPLAYSKSTDNGKYTELGTQIRGVNIPPRSVYWEFGTRDAGNTWVVSYDVIPPNGTLAATLYGATAFAHSANALDATSPVPAETLVQSAPAPTINVTAAVEGLCLVGGETPGDERRLTYTVTAANQAGSTCGEHYHRTVVYQNLSDLVVPVEGTTFGSVFTGVPPSAFAISNTGQFTAGGTSLYGVDIPSGSVYWDLGTLEVGQSRTLTISMDLKATTRYGGPIPVGHLAESTATIRSGLRAQTASKYVKFGFGYNGFGGIRYSLAEKIRESVGSTPNVDDNPNLSVGYGDRLQYFLGVGNESASTLVDTVMIQKIAAGTSLAAALATRSSYVVRYNTGGAANADDAPPDFTRATHAFGPSWTTVPPSDLRTVRWVALDVPFIDSDVPDECTGTSSGGGSHFNVLVSATVDRPADGCTDAVITTRGLFHTKGVRFPGDAAATPIPDTGTWALSDLERVNVKPARPGLGAMSISADPPGRVGPGPVTFIVNVPNIAVGASETATARDAVITLSLPRMSINGVPQPVEFVSAKAVNGIIDYSGLPDRLLVRYATIAPRDTRTIELVVKVLSGFVSGHSLALTASGTAQDDTCGEVKGVASRSVIATGNPYLDVKKNVNLGVGARGAEIEYALSYANRGETVSTGSWIVDQVPTSVALASATAVPNGGEVWFSNQSSPLLPTTLRAASPLFTGALIRANFVRGVVDGQGRIAPPPGFGRVTWVAFLVDDSALNPPLLKTDAPSKVYWTASVLNGAELGGVILNEAAIFSNELLPAISNEANTIISDDPSLEVVRSCPDVTSAGQELTYRVAWVNNSTNDDYQVRFIETLPAFVTVVRTAHTWNSPGSAQFGGVDLQPTWNAGQRTLTWDVSHAIDPNGTTAVGSFVGGEFEITVRVAPGTPTGTFTELSGVATATDLTETLPLALGTACFVYVENPDLYVRIGIDQAEPVSGETVNYTLIASNMGANIADDTSLVVTLPVGVSYSNGPGGVSLFASPGWSFAGSSAPVVTVDTQGREVLTWSLATNNALRRSDLPAARFPARSGPVNLTFQARVGIDVAPASTLLARADIATTTAEDAVYPNTDSVTAVTPLPDPKIDKSGPAFAQPGVVVTYRLQYTNQSRQPAPSVFLVDKLWDDAPADGQADVTLISVTTANNEVVYYNAASLTGAEPAFNPSNPAATGWRTAIGTDPVNWVGFYRTNLAGSSGPYSIYLDIALRTPVTGREPQAGASILNVATIKIPQSVTPDQDPSNDRDETVTQTPGVDVGAEIICDPVGAYPGAAPGQEVGLTLALKNQGTTRAYGLKIEWTPASWFELLSDDTATVTVLNDQGVATNAIDENGAPVGGLRWTRTATGFVLGELSETDPHYYRKVGIPSSSRVAINARGRVRSEVAHNTNVTHDLTVTTDYRFDFDPQNDDVEEITLNNAASCQTRVYRADPRVIKTAGGVNATAPFAAGQQLEYDIAYNNIGGTSAEGVFIEDSLPAGTAFVVGSLSNTPAGTTVSYDDGSGNFAYTPSGAVGVVDPNVKSFRVAWDEALPAPAGGTFRQDTRFDFEDGTFSGTAVSADGERVIVTGATGLTGTYTTPPIPNDPTATVAEWGTIVVDSLTDTDGNPVTVSVLDADTDEVIASGLVPDPSGAIDLDLDPDLHRRIRLAVVMTNPPPECALVPFAETGSTESLGGDVYVANNYSPGPVIYVPSAAGGLVGFPVDTFPGSPGSDHWVQWISPDHHYAVGNALGQAGCCEAVMHVLWELDEAAGRYRVQGLPGAGSTYFRGAILGALTPMSFRGSSAPTWNSGWNDNVERTNGIWFHTPTKPQPFVWLANVLPEISPWYKNIVAVSIGDDYVVVEYVDATWETRAVIVESDPNTQTGIRLSLVPQPPGMESWRFQGNGGRQSDLLVGSLVSPPGGDDEEAISRGYLWKRDTNGQWQLFQLSPADFEGGQSYSRRRAGLNKLPLVDGSLYESLGWRWAQPNPTTGGIGFGPMPFQPYSNEAGTGFWPWTGFDPSDWIYTPGGNSLSPFYEGFVPVLFLPGGLGPGSVQGFGYRYLRDDMSWGSVPLPKLGEGDSEKVSIQYAAPGPVLYGWSYLSGLRGPKSVAWYFPDGDRAHPVIVDLQSRMLAKDPDTGLNVPVICGDLGTYSKPGADGYAPLVFQCAPDAGSGFEGKFALAVVTPSPRGIEVALTPLHADRQTPLVNQTTATLVTVSAGAGDHPKQIVCGAGQRAAKLDSIQVLYRTDKDPSFQYRVEVDDVCQVAVTNTARIYTSSSQITEGNDGSSVTSDIETTDLGVVMTADRGSVLAGQSLTYTARVTNRGPGVARNVAVSLDWPSGSGVGGTHESQLIDGLRPGEVRTFSKLVNVTATAANITLDAAAVVETDTIDCDTSDDIAVARALTGEIPNVAVTLTGPATWQVGQTARYVTTAFNDGTVTANDITLTVSIPPYGTLQQIVVDANGLDVSCAQAGGLVVCDIASLEPLDQSGLPAVVTLVMSNLTCGDAAGTFGVEAIVDAVLDANSADNHADTSTTILGAPGALSLSATPSRSTVRTGDTVTWFIHYQNDGTEAVSGALLEATIPTGATLSAAGTTPGYSVNGSTLRWTLPAIAVRRGGTIALSVNVTGAAPATLASTARIVLPLGSNACAVDAPLAGVTISAPGLQVIKRASASVGCGDAIAWLITVTNDGPTTLNNLVVSDTVPAASPYIGGSINGLNAVVAGPQSLRWTLPALASGESLTVGFSSQGPASSGLVVSNTATVSQGTTVLATSAPAAVWATCNGAALRMTKTSGAGCAVDGGTVEFTVSATNTTINPLSDVVISDPLAAGSTFLASTTGATLDGTLGVIRQVAPTLLAGQTVTMRYSARTNGGAGQISASAATGTATGIQPQVSNPVGAAIQDCDDGDACTTDACDPFAGCSYVAPLPRVSACLVAGHCPGAVTQVCVGGTYIDAGECATTISAVDLCDGVDDDCDGSVDEDFVESLTSCGDGVCAGVGHESCVDGVIVDTCTVGAPFTGRLDFESGYESAGGDVFVGNAKASDGDVAGAYINWSPDGGVADSGHVYGTAPVFDTYGSTQRFYSLSDTAPTQSRLLGGRIDGYFRTLGGQVRAHSGTTASARARWFITAVGTDGTMMIWVSRDTQDWNPNDDTTWTQHGVDIVFENFALWYPFRARGAIGTRAEFEDTVRNVTVAGVWYTDAALDVSVHRHASWSTVSNYAMYSAGTGPVQLGWDNIRYHSTDTADNTCDGVDDDCDGVADQDFHGPETSCGAGACRVVTEMACVDGVIVDLCVPGTPTAELCNGLDDDCDEDIDEDLTREVACGVGACAENTATQTCTLGVWSAVTCDPFAGASPEVCNDIDDDCNGTVDDGLETTTVDCVLPGGCGGVRSEACVGGVLVPLGACLATGSTIDLCNGLDDDCDGETDEDFVPEPITCNADSCNIGQGVTTCECGELGNTCDPAWQLIPDSSCSASDGAVAYAIVYDEGQVARGTIRCAQDGAGVVRCDEDPAAPGQFKVYDELWCPGVSPAPEPKQCADKVGWSKAFGPDSDWSDAIDVTTDLAGNVYLVGYLYDPIDLGAGPLGAVHETHGRHGFYAKYASDGTPLWSFRVGDLTEDSGSQVARVVVDPEGFIYLSGRYSETNELGGQVFGAGEYGNFVAKVAADGLAVWVETFPGTNDWKPPLDLSPDGDIYLALESTVRRLRPDGSVAWVRALASSGFGRVSDLAVASNERIIVGGYFEGTMITQSATLVASDADGFLIALDEDGTELWARRLGGPSQDYLTGLAIDDAGTVACVGMYQDGTDWGAGPLTANGWGGVLARFSAGGLPLSTQPLGGNSAFGQIWFEGMAIGADGLIAITGGGMGEVTIGGMPLPHFPGYADWDAFVALLGTDGQALWVASTQVRARDDNPWSPDGWGYAVARSSSGAVIGTGYFIGEADFGFGPISKPGEGNHLYLVSFPPEGPQ